MYILTGSDPTVAASWSEVGSGGDVIEYVETLPTGNDIQNKIYNAKVEGAWIFYEIQPFNSQLTTASLILIGCSVLAFATNTHSRRKYYIANYVSVAISSVANVAVAVWSIINVAKFKHQFQTTVDFEALKEYSEKWDTLYIDPSQTFWFDTGFVISALLIAVALLAIVNMIWKIQLMKEEKRLIEGGV